MLKKKDLLSQEYKDSASITIFVNTSFRVKRLGYERFGAEKNLFFPTLSFHWRDSHPIVAALVLRYCSKQSSQ